MPRAAAKPPRKEKTMTEYRGYAIEFNFYGLNEYSVQYNGDYVMFETEEDAMLFIDEVMA